MQLQVPTLDKNALLCVKTLLLPSSPFKKKLHVAYQPLKMLIEKVMFFRQKLHPLYCGKTLLEKVQLSLWPLFKFKLHVASVNEKRVSIRKFLMNCSHV